MLVFPPRREAVLVPRPLPPQSQLSLHARVVAYALLSLLFALRLPSLVQPAGADQGLYGYVATRILEGELPYRDAWDQKPPAIHFTYALLFAIWPWDSVAAAADLAIAGVVALLLVSLGAGITGNAGAGLAAAAIFLLLGDPTLTRLAGVRVRAQCETFIAAAVIGAIVLALTGRAITRARMLLIGVLLGLAVTYKYNAIVYAPIAFLALARNINRNPVRRGAWLLIGLGMLVPVCAMLALFAAGGALQDLVAATLSYNVEYSGETYAGPRAFVRYLLTFPVQQARIDALWTVGGLGCLILMVPFFSRGARRRVDPRLALPVVWVCAACVSIAINGSRGLPQYFVQAAPALALASGVGASVVWPASRLPAGLRSAARWAALALVCTAAWRVTDFDKIPENAAHDLAYAAGRLPRDSHLARYGGGRTEDKYSALAVARLGHYLKVRTRPDDRVYIFGFSPGAYLHAERASGSRFFWSRPVIVGFNADAPGYGSVGVLEELRARVPAYVVLQRHDWAPPPRDSATYFLTHPALGSWLRAHYRRVNDFSHEDYDVWALTPAGDQVR